MEEIKNNFYLTLENDDKRNFEILFQDKEDFNKSTIEEFSIKLKDFIVLQKDNENINLDFIFFHEYYNILDEESSFTKILKELNILNYSRNEENKKCATINNVFTFNNTFFYERVEFIRTYFNKKISFEGATFESDINFDSSKFIFENKKDNEIEVSFEGIICKKEAIFNSVEFFNKVSFLGQDFMIILVLKM